MTTRNARSMYQTLPHDVNASIQLIGSPNFLYPMSQFTSASRTGMLGHNLPQMMVNRGSEPAYIFTGVEKQLTEMTFDASRREEDVQILEILPKFRFNNVIKGTIETCPSILVICVGEKSKELTYFEIKRYELGMNGFGFMTEMHNRNRIRKGAIIEKDMPISTSPQVHGNRYAYGKNMNVCYASFPGTIEDAFGISESAARAFMTDMIYQVKISSRPDRRPVNAFGTATEERPFLDIGQKIGKDGVIHASRPVRWNTCTIDTDPDLLREVLPAQDDVYYGTPGAEIIDLDFVANPKNLTESYNQVKQYQECQRPYWLGIWKTYQMYKNQYRPSKEMRAKAYEAFCNLAQTGYTDFNFLTEANRRHLRNADIESPVGGILEFLHTTVTYRADRKVVPGDKWSNCCGGKGVIGVVMKDEHMPIDEHGNRADVMIAMGTPVARTNMGQLYEQGLNFISSFVQKETQRVYEVKGVDAATEVLKDWAEDVNPNYRTILDRTLVTKDDKEAYVKDAIEDFPKLWIPPFHENFTPSKEDQWNALRNMMRYQEKWKAYPTPITYYSPVGNGEWKKNVTETPVVIAAEYFIHLNKLPKISAPGVSRVNHLGIPTKSSTVADMYPVKINPSRFGEDEHRISLMDVDVRWVVRLQNTHGNSPFKGVNRVIRELLLNPHPTNIPVMPVSNGELLEGSTPLRLFHSTLGMMGLDTKNTAVKEHIVSEQLGWAADALEEIDSSKLDVNKINTTSRGKRA